MSLPNYDRETLLSAALDGELSVQEQADFDRAIASDPAFAGEFEELQSLRSALRLSLAEVRRQTLPAGTTERIVAAAMAAKADPLSTPQAPDSHVQQAPRSTRGKWAAALALAASALLGVTFWNRQAPAPPIAQGDPQGDPQVPAEHTAIVQNTQSDTQGDAGLENAATPPRDQPPQVPDATADIESIASQPMEPRTADTPSRPKVMSIKPVPDAAPAPEAVATSDVAPKTMPDAQTAVDPAGRAPLEVVLVLAVEQTQEGRDQLALQEALRANDIRLGAESVMGSDLVGHLQQADVIDSEAGTEQSAGKLYFIEASAKRIDRLTTYLMTEKELFASVGLSLAENPPLLAVVSGLREIDPTKVRQNVQTGIARDLVASDGKALALDPNRPFLPLDRDIVDSLLQPANPDPNRSANTDDFPSQLLLFVK